MYAATGDQMQQAFAEEFFARQFFNASVARLFAPPYNLVSAIAVPAMPCTPDELLAHLKAMGIATQTIHHPPLHTVAQSRALRGKIPGAHAKNLFVKDKKGRLFLISALENAALDLKQPHQSIGGQGRVSFGSAELLEEVLGVRPGCVTPFAAINDQGRVTIVLDADLMAHNLLNFHPLANNSTTSIAATGLLTFLRASGHEPVIVALPKSN